MVVEELWSTLLWLCCLFLSREKRLCPGDDSNDSSCSLLLLTFLIPIKAIRVDFACVLSHVKSLFTWLYLLQLYNRNRVTALPSLYK